MQLIRRFRIPALFCALAVLVCELISRPYAQMGICDDGPYILMARHLAASGHIVYNGGEAAMLGSQLYLAAAFVKLFGFSFTAPRMSTILIAMMLAFILQRILVRTGLNERNATLGTLTFVLSPLYLILSATFMSDIPGVFAVVVCLYGCLRALQSRTSGATIGWLCFAILTNAIFGTTRQIAWLGILVMVPSTLWLLRAQRRVLIAGAAAAFAGVLFIFCCIHWFSLQPYTLPEHLLVNKFPISYTLGNLSNFLLDIPFLLLPIVTLFLPEIRKSSPRVIGSLLLGYLFIGVHPRHPNKIFLLEPTMRDGRGRNWVNVDGFYQSIAHGRISPLLHTDIQVLVTILSFVGLLGLIALFFRAQLPSSPGSAPGIPWKQLGILLAPFAVANLLLLVPRAATSGLFDRYALVIVLIAVICLGRLYQDRISARFPSVCVLLIAIMAVYGIVSTHNTFSLYRARVVLAAELNTNGIPDTYTDNGWEYNFDVEIQHTGYINDPRIVIPPGAHAPVSTPAAGPCPMFLYGYTPSIHALYGISFDPDACNGPAPFAPVHYSRWLASSPGTLYAVRYTAPATP